MLLRPINLLAYLAGPMRELRPYAVVALIVPGGCLIALLFWAFRNRMRLRARVRRLLARCGINHRDLVVIGIDWRSLVADEVASVKRRSERAEAQGRLGEIEAIRQVIGRRVGVSERSKAEGLFDKF